MVRGFDAAQTTDRLLTDLTINLELFVYVHLTAIKRRRQQQFLDRFRLSSLDNAMRDKRVDYLMRSDAVVAVILSAVDAVHRRRLVYSGSVLANLLAQTQHAQHVLGAENSLQVQQLHHEAILQHFDRFPRKEHEGGVAERTVSSVVSVASLSVPVFQTAGTVRVETWKDVWIGEQLFAQWTCRYFVGLFHRCDRHVPNTQEKRKDDLNIQHGISWT